MALADKTCEPCHGGTPKLNDDQIKSMSKELTDWTVDRNFKLQKSIKTKDFASALALANKVGEIAEQQGHHPDLKVSWGELFIEIWTHAISGLSEADFILASKIDRLSASS